MRKTTRCFALLCLIGISCLELFRADADDVTSGPGVVAFSWGVNAPAELPYIRA